MTMPKLNTLILGTACIAGLAASWVIQRHAQTKLRANEVILRQQEHQLAELMAQNQRLSNRVSEPNTAEDQTTELTKLRTKAEALREQTDGRRLAADQSQSWTPQSASSLNSATGSSVSSHVVSDSDSEEYRVELYRLACAAPHSYPLTNNWTMDDARNLGWAVRKYAREHQGEFPSDFDQAADYYRKDKPLPRTSDFELVFQGSRNELANVPEQAIALLRERQAWQTSSGKWARIYVMAGGDVKVVESDDGFQSWEAEHVIPPPLSGLK